MALRGCPRLLRIGAFIDPAPALAKQAVAAPDPAAVPSGDLAEEAGSRAADGHELLLPAARAARDAAFAARCDEVEAAHRAAAVATPAAAAELLAHGSVELGLDMFEHMDARGRLAPPDYAAVLRALACPAVWEHHYSWEHDAMGACKRLGEFRGEERARESLHVFDRLLAALRRRRESAQQPAEAPLSDPDDGPAAPQVSAAAGVTLADMARDDQEYAVLVGAWNAVLNVHCTAGYANCLRVPDELYDLMFARKPQIQPTLATYLAVMRALGLATRMEECESVWGWLLTEHSERLCTEAWVTVMECMLEAERWLGVEALFAELADRGWPHLNSRAFDVLCLSIHRYAHSAKGTIPASEEKKLIFFPTWMRQHGVNEADLAVPNQRRVRDAVARWTHRRGLAKTTEWMLDAKRREYEAWNEGQRWRHIKEDDVNTSLIEAGVRRMRGDEIKERMRLDVQAGGGRGTIFPPPAFAASTRYDSLLHVRKEHIAWEQEGLAKDVFPAAPPPADAASAAEAAQQELQRRQRDARRLVTRGGGARARDSPWAQQPPRRAQGQRQQAAAA
eukprot:TRINITY_DN6813_c0_g2_i1.p1 TRINITY_DN6813_c0_g2~~TRINITY_DN6813_c0_g2_i1.p1  ORF type:complete len:587 (+),score=192.82 TRINITY_DN6813_c0_g2_i1:70-1761(+)